MFGQDHPWNTRTYGLGVNRDTDGELISPEEASALDSFNMIGDDGRRDKIKGEEITFPNIDNRCIGGTGLPVSGDLFCIGSRIVNRKLFEVVCDKNEVEPTFIRIDGKIVAMSPLLPFVWNKPLQMDINDSCVGGEVFLTDFSAPPFIFSVKDLLENSGIGSDECTQKYFEEFDPSEHYLQIQGSLNRPEFLELTSEEDASIIFQTQGTNGLQEGMYTYSVQYESESGERSQRSMVTPMIPVVTRVSASGTPAYPWAFTYAKLPDPDNPSIYGTRMRLRVDNTNNYSIARIIRTKWNINDPLTSPGITEVAGFIPLSGEVVQVFEFIDKGGFEEFVPDDEDLNIMTAISKAKSVRYFNRKVHLGNVTFAEKEVADDEVEFATGSGNKKIYPAIMALNTAGHADPWHATYFRHYITQEKVGFAVIFWDGQNGFSFAKDEDFLQEYTAPKRRDLVSGNTKNISLHGIPKGSIDGGSVGYTHDVSHLRSPERKIQSDQYFNILNDGTKNGVSGSDLGHRPFGPTGHSDGDVTGLRNVINPSAIDEDPSAGLNPEISYTPKGFAPDYYAHGVALHGITKWPSWAKGFSVVRTESAKRVVAQGMAYYALRPGQSNVGTAKTPNKCWLYLPDGSPAHGIDPNILDNIINNPQDYYLEVAAPVGFFTEVYSFLGGNVNASRKIDMITYARVDREQVVDGDGLIHPQDGDIAIDGLDGYRYIGNGSWRRLGTDPQQQGVFANYGGGTTEFNITSAQLQSTDISSRSRYLEVTMDQEMFFHEYSGANYKSTDQGVRRWHEPVYIVNVIRKNAGITTQNVVEYQHTGHFQKIESLIGVGDSALLQDFPLVDDRWEDCIHYPENADPTLISESDFTSYERFIYVQDSLAIKRRWLNVKYRTLEEIEEILEDIQNNGFHEVTDASGTYSIYGVFKDTQETVLNRQSFNIRFEVLSQNYSEAYQIPQQDQKIFIAYDSRIPIQVFGGEGWVNESIWAPIDIPPDTPLFWMNRPFIFRSYFMNTNIHIVRQTTGINKIQDNDIMKFSGVSGNLPADVRQLVNMFCCETRSNLVYAHNDGAPTHRAGFPKINYVMRPYEFVYTDPLGDANDFLTNNNMFSEYFTDYDREWLYWKYGGFKIYPENNLDFSQRNKDTRVISSAPRIGFKEITEYCSRVIWSLQRATTDQRSPALRTFNELNYYDLPDDTGGINLLWSANSGNGESLYALTTHGTCLLLSDMRLLHEVSGDEIAQIGSENAGVLKHIFLDQNIGSPDEFWRGAAEHGNMLIFPNKKGVFMLVGTQLENILKTGTYENKLKPVLNAFTTGFSDHMTAGYDPEKDLYMLTVKRTTPSFNQVQQSVGKEGVYAVDSEQIEGVPDAIYDYGIPLSITGATVIIASGTDPELQQQGLFLGGYYGALLTTDVVVCVPAKSIEPVVVRYRENEGQDWAQIIIAPGSCYYFTYNLVEGPTYPYGIPHSYFTIEEYDLAGNTAEFVDDGHGTFIYSPERKKWQGVTEHRFDSYANDEEIIMGSRSGEAYTLQRGFMLNDSPIKAQMIGICNVESQWDKEFIAVRINSNVKPEKIRFYLTVDDAVADNALCEVGEDQIKNRFGYEAFIPRAQVERHRLQGRLLLYRIIHTLESEFRVVSAMTQHKRLK